MNKLLQLLDGCYVSKWCRFWNSIANEFISYANTLTMVFFFPQFFPWNETCKKSSLHWTRSEVIELLIPETFVFVECMSYTRIPSRSQHDHQWWLKTKCNGHLISWMTVKIESRSIPLTRLMCLFRCLISSIVRPGTTTRLGISWVSINAHTKRQDKTRIIIRGW